MENQSIMPIPVDGLHRNAVFFTCCPACLKRIPFVCQSVLPLRLRSIFLLLSLLDPFLDLLAP